MSKLGSLSVPAAADRHGEREVEHLTFLRIRNTNGLTRWVASSEIAFPQPYTVVALEAHYADVLHDLQRNLDEGPADTSQVRSNVLLAVARRDNGSLSVLFEPCSPQEKLGRTLLAYELVKGLKQLPESSSTDERVPLAHLLEPDLRNLIRANELVDFAYILSIFDDVDGNPSGWAYRATSAPNRFELLGVLAIEIDELKDAIRNADEIED